MNEAGIWADIDVRVLDQRIGVGVGGMETIIRVWHKPTGIIVEIPRTNRGQHKDRQTAVEMIEYAISEIAP